MGVRELLQESESNKEEQNKSNSQASKDRVTGKAKRKRMDMYEIINATDYYGFGDDDDNELFWREKKMEAKLRNAKISQWKKQNPDKVDDLERRSKDNKDTRMRVTKMNSLHVPSKKRLTKLYWRNESNYCWQNMSIMMAIQQRQSNWQKV